MVRPCAHKRTPGSSRGLTRLTIIAAASTAILAASHAGAEEQTRIYDSSRRSTGTAVPFSDGSVRYYDARVHSLGTSSTSGGTTTYSRRSGRRARGKQRAPWLGAGACAESPHPCPPARSGAGSRDKDRRPGLRYSASIALPGMGGADEALPSTARIHRWTRRRGGVAAGGARAAGRPRAADRRADVVRPICSARCSLGVTVGMRAWTAPRSSPCALLSIRLESRASRSCKRRQNSMRPATVKGNSIEPRLATCSCRTLATDIRRVSTTLTCNRLGLSRKRANM